jgi:hypothetical protein
MTISAGDCRLAEHSEPLGDKLKLGTEIKLFELKSVRNVIADELIELSHTLR